MGNDTFLKISEEIEFLVKSELTRQIQRNCLLLSIPWLNILKILKNSVTVQTQTSKIKFLVFVRIAHLYFFITATLMPLFRI